VRLFSGMFSSLAAQALLATTVPAGLLMALVHQSHAVQTNARDSERLEAFAQIAAEAVRAGRPLDQVLGETNARRGRLAGRLALVDANGALVAGSAAGGPVRAEQAVQVDGRTVAQARIVAPPRLGPADRHFLMIQYMGVGVVFCALLAVLLLAAYGFARRWAGPQLALHRLSREAVHGEQELHFDEDGPAEVVATMRNLRRIATQFSRIETARRTWLVSIADELKRPVENMAEHFARLRAVEPKLPPALIEAIAEDMHRLIHMSEDLSAVALADLGRLPVHFAEVDPRALIHNSIWAHRKRAEAQQVRLETSSLPGYTILVQWDGARIEQLFGALIDNALRYTPAGGRIVLGLESSRDAWRLIVDDSAPGVDVMLAQSLFEPFYRSVDRTDESAASGLGLATARAIVEGHHGRIEASRSPIGGLRVTVVLPARPPTA